MAKKVERPTFAVPTAILPSVERFIAAKQVAEMAEGRMKAEEGIVKETMIDSFAESLVKLRCKPTNPRMTIAKDGKPDIECLFQVQSKFYPQAVQGDGPVSERLKAAFVAAGVSDETAGKLLQYEVTCEDKTTIRPFSELMNGAPVEQELAGRVMKLLLDNFTDQERALILQPSEKVEVKDGFFERLGMYVKDKAECLAAMRVMKPVCFMSHMKLGLSETPQGRLNRLFEYAKSMICG